MIAVYESVIYITGHLTGMRMLHHWTSGMLPETLSERVGRTYSAILTGDQYQVMSQELKPA